MRSFEYTMKNTLTARPASELSVLCKRYKSKVTLKTDYKTVDAEQFMLVLAIGLQPGTQITVIAEGPDEEDALDAVQDFMEARL